MGLRDVFARGALTIRQAFDDVPTLVDLQVWASTVYDPDTGAGSAWATAAADVPAFWLDYNAMQVDGQNVLSDDRLVLVAALDLPPGLVPSTNDRLVDVPTGEVWAVQRVLTDPADAHYQMQVRR